MIRDIIEEKAIKLNVDLSYFYMSPYIKILYETYLKAMQEDSDMVICLLDCK